MIQVDTPIALAGRERAVRTRRIAVAEVTAAARGWAEVAIGQDERVAPGTLARETRDGRSESLFAPPRLGGLYTAEITVRPFLALGTLGIGSVNQAAASYRFDIPFTVEAAIDPIGAGYADEARSWSGLATVVPPTRRRRPGQLRLRRAGRPPAHPGMEWRR